MDLWCFLFEIHALLTVKILLKFFLSAFLDTGSLSSINTSIMKPTSKQIHFPPINLIFLFHNIPNTILIKSNEQTIQAQSPCL